MLLLLQTAWIQTTAYPVIYPIHEPKPTTDDDDDILLTAWYMFMAYPQKDK